MSGIPPGHYYNKDNNISIVLRHDPKNWKVFTDCDTNYWNLEYIIDDEKHIIESDVNNKYTLSDICLKMIVLLIEYRNNYDKNISLMIYENLIGIIYWVGMEIYWKHVDILKEDKEFLSDMITFMGVYRDLSSHIVYSSLNKDKRTKYKTLEEKKLKGKNKHG